MAANTRGRGALEIPRHWRDRETSPERTKVWTEPKPKVAAAAAATAASAERRVPVVYYLSRNGHLEHPHFMEVTLSSVATGLYLRDVVDRLNYLRGKGMASMYAWSSKRSYKNGFVWHDLADDDLIHPVHGHEYVLKGSELLQGAGGSPSSRDTGYTASAASSSSGSDKSLDAPKPYQDDTDSAPPTCKKQSPWQSFDLNEYKVYKAESSADATLKAADASTQTDDRRLCRRSLIRDDRCRGDAPKSEEINPTTELGPDEISPPPSSSSPETLETLIKADVRSGAGGRAAQDPDQAPGAHPSGRVRASAVLMQLISCGSLSVKDHGGFTLVSQYRARLPRGGGGPEASDHKPTEPEVAVDRASFPAVTLEDKEYFSGSLIETKKKAAEGAGELASLKRSSSFNADRSSKLDLAEKEVDGVRAKCIPRRPGKASSSIARRGDGGNKGSSSARSTDGVKQPDEQRT